VRARRTSRSLLLDPFYGVQGKFLKTNHGSHGWHGWSGDLPNRGTVFIPQSREPLTLHRLGRRRCSGSDRIYRVKQIRKFCHSVPNIRDIRV